MVPAPAFNINKMNIPNNLTEANLNGYLIPRGNNRAVSPYPKKVFYSGNVYSFEVLFRMPHADSLFHYQYPNEYHELVTDQDYLDWSKICGFHLNRWPYQNSKDTLLLGFRQQSYEEGLWAITPYVNYRRKHIVDKDCIHTFKTKELAHAFFKRERPDSKTWDCYVGEPGGKHLHTKLTTAVLGYGRRDKMRTLRGPWYGGTNNAPGPYGDKAPTTMFVEFAMKVNQYRNS